MCSVVGMIMYVLYLPFVCVYLCFMQGMLNNNPSYFNEVKVAEHKLYDAEYSLSSYSASERGSAVLNPNIRQHGPKIPPFGTLLGYFTVLCDQLSYCSLVCAKVSVLVPF